jgi:outer membrane receptor protein involved in Fe transport
MHGFPKLLVVSLLGALLTGGCLGQTVTGNLDGHVTDPAGANVPGATVSARNLATGAERSTTTNEEGYFSMPYLPIGSYDVTVKKEGFAVVVAKANAVTLNKTTTLNLSLQLSTVESSVTIAEASPLIDVTSGQIRRGLADDMLSDLPIGGRDFKNIAAVLPGFQTNPTAGQNNPTLSSGSSVSFNGTGTRGTSFLTDGIANDDYSENQNRQNVNVETVKEMQVMTNSYSAEFGRGLGAVVLVQTKSGTNTTHGEAYGFTTNSALNARDFFSNASGSHVDSSTGKLVPNVKKAVSRTFRMGGIVGGPVIKDKLFYFGSFERYWTPGSALVTTYLIPQQYLTPAVNPALPSAAADAAFIKSVAARFPTDLTPNAPAISPYAWQGPEPRSSHTHDYSGRADYVVSERDTIYGRYQWSTYYYGLQAEPVKGENMVQDHKFQNVGLTWTHVFSPRMTGEFRTGFGRRNMYVGFLDPNDRPPIIRWSVSGFSNIMGNASAYPILRIQNDFQYVYNFSWLLGNHQTLKIGTDIRRTQLNDNTENYNRGYYAFSSANGLNAFQNFQQGIVQTFTQGFGPAYIGERITESNFYVQDDIRVASNFTLNLGARFERVGAPTEVNHLIPPDYKSDSYVDPRFGFAWSPKSDGFLSKLLGGAGMTSVRGGFGLYHGRVFESLYSQIGASSRFNPPNAAVLSWSNPNEEVANPTFGFVFTPGPPKSQVSLTYSDPNFHMPYTEQWNLTLERQLPWKSAFQATYAGNRGIGLLFYNWGNRAQFPVVSTQPASYGTQAQGYFTGVLFNQIDPNLFNSNPAPGFISLTQPRTNARRTNGAYGSFLIVSNAAWSYYNGLQLTYTQKTFKGLNMQASYTWSKNIDTGSEATSVGSGDINAAVSETQGMASLRGNSRLAQPQRFVVSFVYEIPLYRDQRGPDSLGFLAPVVGRVLGGWRVSGNTIFASGNPFTVMLGYDLNGDGIGGDRPDLLDPSILGRSISNGRQDPATGLQYAQEALPISAFAPTAAQAAAKAWPWYPGTGYVGSLGRNTFWLCGQNNWDLAFSKDVRLYGERHHLQFRAEMYNFTNRVQFGMPAYTSVVDTGVPGYRLQPNLGKITSQANSPRNMMMMLKYVF